MSCSICKKRIDEEKAPILSMGGMGYPRYLCDECAAELECATEGNDSAQIRKAMSAIAEKITKNNIDDGVVIETVQSIFKEAKIRLEKIDSGEPVEEITEKTEELDDVPEELLESEEDRELDEIESVKKKKLDAIFNWISVGILTAAIIGFLVYFIFLR